MKMQRLGREKKYNYHIIKHAWMHIYVLLQGGSVTSFFRYKISYTHTILVIMVFIDCNSNIFNDLKAFSNLSPGTVFCMVIFMGKKCVIARSENRESGPTAFQMIFLESSNSRKNWLSHFPRAL